MTVLRPRFLPLFALLLATACSSGSGKNTGTSPTTGTGTTTGPTTSTPDPQTYEALEQALAAQDLGFGVGHVTYDAAENCCEWDSCLHVNPDGEYGTWALPPHPDEWIGDKNPDELGRIVTWRLRQDEAVLYIGKVPPGARYVSFRSYVHDVATETGREDAFTNLGDTLNQEVWQINEDGTLLVLTTAHAETLDKVRQAAVDAGWPALNLDQLAEDRIDMGLEQGDDNFRVTQRIAGISDPAAWSTWRENPDARVYRITPETELDHVLLPDPTVRTPVAQPDPGLDAAVAELRQAIIDAHPGWTVVDANVDHFEPVPDEPTCWDGCNRDVSYANTPGSFLPEGTKLIPYGVDPVHLGRATWTAVVLVGMQNNDSGGGVSTDALTGSAADYLPANHAELDKLYAWTFTRDCQGEDHCTDVPTGCPGIEALEGAGLFWRHYLDPVTHTYPPFVGLGPRGALKLVPPP